MTDTLAIALAQINPIVGDVAGNLAKVRAARAEAGRLGADLVVFSELVLSGYPPEDLVLKPAFQRRLREAVEALKADTASGGAAALVPTPCREDTGLDNTVRLLDGAAGTWPRRRCPSGAGGLVARRTEAPTARDRRGRCGE